jgi:hypothetical protein
MSRAAAALLLSAGVALGVSGCDFGRHPNHVQLGVQLVLEHCPLITTWKAAPLQATAPGGTIDVSVTAIPSIDRDGGVDAGRDGGADGGVASGLGLEYIWSADSGSFADSTAPSTIYTCATPGPQRLTISVIDKKVPVACSDVVSIAIVCKAAH